VKFTPAATRDLLWLLTLREIRIRYARALLGAAWALFGPLVMMAVFTLMNFARLFPPDSAYAAVPYSLFALCGLLPWTHFSISLTQGTPSLVLARELLKKSAFPREVIPLSRMLAALLDLGIGCLFLAALFAWHGIALRPSALAVPVILALQIAFTAGLVLLLSSANMFFRDVNYVVQAGVVLAMFATSVVYDVTRETVSVPLVGAVLEWNPMSSYLDAYRRALLLGEWPWARLVPGALGAVASAAGGLAVFRTLERRFAEEA
jgi:lipopolysaccharide transport system permease protein